MCRNVSPSDIFRSFLGFSSVACVMVVSFRERKKRMVQERRRKEGFRSYGDLFFMFFRDIFSRHSVQSWIVSENVHIFVTSSESPCACWPTVMVFSTLGDCQPYIWVYIYIDESSSKRVTVYRVSTYIRIHTLKFSAIIYIVARLS